VIIKNLKLNNYRCFKSFDIQFNEQLSVIVGGNGAGKTSILEGIAIAISTMFVQFSELSGRRILKTDVRRKSYVIGSTDDVQLQYPVEVIASGKVEGADITWTRSLNSADGNTTIKNAKPMINVADRYQQRLRVGDTTLILPIISYYGTGRLWDYHRQKKNDTFKDQTRTNGYIDSMDGTTNIKLMMDWFKKMTVKKYQRQEENKGGIPELDTVYSAMEKCLALTTEYSDIKIRYNIDTNELDVYYTDVSGQRMRISLNQMSDGYKSTISLVADIAYRMAVLNPQLMGDVLVETNGIVLVDEVDLHLHPEWQQHILNDLTTIFPKVQFIVTTHAPAVINTVRSDNLVILHENEAQEPVGEVYGKDTNTIIRGVMRSTERPERVKALFAKFYDLLALDGKLDDAEKCLTDIELLCGNDDSELAACRVKLKLQQMRRGKHG